VGVLVKSLMSDFITLVTLSRMSDFVAGPRYPAVLSGARSHARVRLARLKVRPTHARGVRRAAPAPRRARRRKLLSTE